MDGTERHFILPVLFLVTGPHFFCCRCRKGNHQDVFRLDPAVFHHVMDPAHQRGSLAASRAGNHDQLPLHGPDGFFLCLICFHIVSSSFLIFVSNMGDAAAFP